jgi:hypothetical protein
MHILIVSFKNGAVEYFGPFPTLFRANEFADAVKLSTGYARHHVASLIVPFNIVQNVVWK